jgi:serine/threonine-protein kinase
MNIPNYTIERQIGEGGMANVYFGKHNILQKNVAIKVLKNEFTYNEAVRKRFVSEARILFEMSHPNLIKVTDMTDQENLAAFVMEYVEGESLKEYMERKGPLDKEEIQAIFSQILSALGYVHEQGYVHRDLKPSNFMIDGKSRIKLLDFGISKVLNSSEQDHNMTATLDRMGTPIYMSPEQVKSAKTVTIQSDIYSLGVILWQMVMGQKPYDSATMSTFDIQTKIVNEELPKTKTTFDETISKATAKNPDDRFSNCEEFMKSLSEAGSQKKGRTSQRKVSPEPPATDHTVIDNSQTNTNKTETVSIPPPSNPFPTYQVRKGNVWNPISLVLGLIIVVVLFSINQKRAEEFILNDFSEDTEETVAVDSTVAVASNTYVSFRNNTNEKVFVAVAYDNYGIESHGWYTIESNQTIRVDIPGGVKNGEIFWYAEGDGTYQSDGSDGMFCVNRPDAFDYVTTDESIDCKESKKAWFTRLYISEGENFCSIK